ncbi:substrate-binding periplasmic protein [Desulfovibrio sp.]
MKTVVLLLALLLLPAVPARAQQAALRMVYAEGFAPFSWTSQGQVAGILPDIMDEAARRMGVTVSHQALPGGEVAAKVKGLGADGFLSVPSPDYDAFSVHSAAPVLTTSIGLFVSLSYEPLIQQLRLAHGLDGLKGLKLCASRYDSWSQARLAGLDLTIYPNLAEALSALARGDAQVMAQVPEVVEFQTARLGLSAQVLRVPGVFLDEIAFHLHLNRHGAAAGLMPAFDKALAEMRADGTLVAILNRPR